MRACVCSGSLSHSLRLGQTHPTQRHDRGDAFEQAGTPQGDRSKARGIDLEQRGIAECAHGSGSWVASEHGHLADKPARRNRCHLLPGRFESDPHLTFEHHEHRLAGVPLLHDALARTEPMITTACRQLGSFRIVQLGKQIDLAEPLGDALDMPGRSCRRLFALVLNLDRKWNLDATPLERVPDIRTHLIPRRGIATKIINPETHAVCNRRPGELVQEDIGRWLIELL